MRHRHRCGCGMWRTCKKTARTTLQPVTTLPWRRPTRIVIRTIRIAAREQGVAAASIVVSSCPKGGVRVSSQIYKRRSSSHNLKLKGAIRPQAVALTAVHCQWGEPAGGLSSLRLPGHGGCLTEAGVCAAFRRGTPRPLRLRLPLSLAAQEQAASRVTVSYAGLVATNRSSHGRLLALALLQPTCC